MNSLSRKQRELADRHALFLNIAREVLHETGFHQLSMDLVADKAEYSKGTLYQHFSCKEEILLQLCNQTTYGMQILGQRAVTYKGTNRERLLAFQVAHELWLALEPSDIYMLQNLHTDGVLEKVDNQSRIRHQELQTGIISMVTSIVQQAMDDGELPSDHLNAAEVVYGLWSMNYGGQLLRSYDISLDQMGVHDPGRAITILTQATLDGLGWQPSMTFEQTDTLLNHLKTDFFNADIEQLRLRNSGTSLQRANG